MSLPIGGDIGVDQAAELLLELSPAGRWLAEHDEHAGLRPALLARIAADIEPFVDHDRVVMSADVWLVSASP
jgi:hypothetical protein